MITKNNTIKFLRQKDFKFIKKLDSGSFGKTILLKDEYINHDFVCKKYEPQEGIQKKDYYNNFVNEIKLLHLLYHDNIVRIFNYYLYPELHLGYIMMEHIDGVAIDVYIENYPENINNIFEQTIKGFIYLEDNNILHRDIRPTNILVDKNHNVKIIDFGFGKEIRFTEDNNKSITINWLGDKKPDDFKQKIYDKKTEIFFIGKLFEQILKNNKISFKYKEVLEKMVKIDHIDRINSFKIVLQQLNKNDDDINPFDMEEIRIYRNFSAVFFNSLAERELAASINMNNDQIIKDIELLQKKIMLEDRINPIHILGIFIKGAYKYTPSADYFTGDSLREFFNFFINISKEKQNMVLYGLEINFYETQSYFDNSNIEVPF